MGSKATSRLTWEGPTGFRDHQRRWVGRIQSSPGFRAPDTVDQHEDEDYEQEAYNCGQAHQPGLQAALCGCGEGKGSARERRGLWERREGPVGEEGVACGRRGRGLWERKEWPVGEEGLWEWESLNGRISS